MSRPGGVPRSARSPQRERGGIALLLVLLLLTAMTAATLGVVHNLVRELRMAGDALQGAQASCAADAGADWVLAWAGEGGDRCGLLQGAPFQGEVPQPGGGVAFRQAFTIQADCLGPAPPGLDTGAPLVLWRVRVQGRAWSLKGGETSPVFLSRRELILAQRPGEAGQGVLQVRAWRTVW